MTENGVHTHAPHEEFVQEAAQGHHKHHSLNQWVAIFTAILASLGAMVSYQGTRTMNEVLLYYAATLEDSRRKLQFDLYYVKNHSLALDLRILFETIRVVLRGEGAR